MATLGSPSPPSSPSRNMRRRGFARRLERFCCNTITYFPLAFVYGLTTWAAWVQAGVGLTSWTNNHVWTGKLSSILGIFLYVMLNWSYTTAVFTDPGSPLNPTNGYARLPTQEGGGMQYTSFTVKASNGDIRFCKKCQTKKPDRAHHCSTCKRCVLKMDHHCPWLATCVGLRNYKAFLLFLIYVSLFCWVAFATSAIWVWEEVISNGEYTETFMPVNCVLLAVLSGIIGLVITGFAAWHLWLTSRGRTTIESLEKTRYLSPLRNSMRQHLNDRNYLDAQAQGRLSISDQLREIHANALPGVTRPEEGESPSRSATPSPANGAAVANGYSTPMHYSYEQRERQHGYDRYENYLDERDNELLPNAFDLGWRRNFGHVFGPSPLLWFLPICNTTGDGWSWEASEKWLAARERIQKQRLAEERMQKERERAAGWGVDSPTEAEFRRTGRLPEGWQTNQNSPPTPRLPRQPEWQAPRKHGEQARYLTTSNGVVHTPLEGRRSPSKADQILGRERGMYADGAVQLQPIVRKKFDQYNYISEDDDDDYDVSSDEERAGKRKAAQVAQTQPPTVTKDWNDIPADFLPPPPKGRAKKKDESQAERRKKNAQEWDDWQ
ncbi:zf-DHHC-domain-containing protein [Westerdykella ornata]|uniref:Palmitoyltransferase n=1 Tax=Westerdykella ornata TaxID=318751 RepID=A0A6A6JR59_WESOR|nr:zf-DHHC-domain-containing protein [Westerdykella ornata]KAF2278755.1 zf-DHHC-domain-containing protein [Westerdykella ornata]